MLFNSYFFIFVFLPVSLLGFYWMGSRNHHRIAISWLVGVSLFFYAWWNPAYLGLILGSMLFNYALGVVLGRGQGVKNKRVLFFGVAVNLALIGYFKYANFFIDSFNSALGLGYSVEEIILPLAISFFTFQQIAYLVDAHKGEAREYNFLNYCLFVTFFPQLIAGPIVHHRDVLPQFAKNTLYKLNYSHLAIGVSIFAIGLFKKVVLADSLAPIATPIFTSVEQGVELSFVESWVGALAYTFQIYFDFSGYSDMAIGLARMFGVVLPQNFNSPYKSESIIEFWRRWHITLSTFLRDYLYIPLGGNKKGKSRRHFNLLVTMLLGGLWHGAGWTFIVWGGLHGLYLILNHSWLSICRAMEWDVGKKSFLGRIFARVITFVAIVVAWVFFRADSLAGANSMLLAMAGANGAPLSEVVAWAGALTVIAVAFLVSFLLPNVQQVMYGHKSVLEVDSVVRGAPLVRWLEWRLSLCCSLVIAAMLLVSIVLLQGESEFLYFRF